jgi:hypothetical protein
MIVRKVLPVLSILTYNISHESAMEGDRMKEEEPNYTPLVKWDGGPDGGFYPSTSRDLSYLIGSFRAGELFVSCLVEWSVGKVEGRERFPGPPDPPPFPYDDETEF